MDVQRAGGQFAKRSAAGGVYRSSIPGGKEQAVGFLTGSGVGREKRLDIKLEVGRQLRKAGTAVEATQSQVDEQILGAFFLNAAPALLAGDTPDNAVGPLETADFPTHCGRLGKLSIGGQATAPAEKGDQRRKKIPMALKQEIALALAWRGGLAAIARRDKGLPGIRVAEDIKDARRRGQAGNAQDAVDPGP